MQYENIKWQKPNEDLPKDYNKVLVLCTNDQIHFSEYNPKAAIYYDKKYQNMNKRVVYWCKIPDLPDDWPSN